MRGLILIILTMHTVYDISVGGDTEWRGNINERDGLTEKAYAKLFRLRRKEKHQLLKILSDETVYEKRYKLLEAGYEKLLTVLSQTKALLEASKYDPLVDKFPQDNQRLVDAISVVLENTCLFGEMLLHHPDMSYMILKRLKLSTEGDWRSLINWCLLYARYFYGRIIDDNSQILLSLTDQEINPAKRLPNFVNPYRAQSNDLNTETSTKKATKLKKKLKKGPQMSRSEL